MEEHDDTWSTVRRILREQLAHLSLRDADLVAEKTLADLGADSLNAIEVLLALEAELHLCIPESDADEIQTLGDLVAYIDEHRLSGRRARPGRP